MRKLADGWTRAEAAALLRLSKIGISKSEAARRLGRHQSTISVHARLAGLTWKPPPKRPPQAKPRPKGPRPRPWTDNDDRLLAQLAAAGVPIGQATNRMDRAYNTVLKQAKRLRLKFERDREGRTRHKRFGR
jgi:phosphoglycolate phosphatase-like HAD superfamily hydrolase